MWTLHDFPSSSVETSHDVKIGPEWLNNVQRSTVRLDNGCTGSFVSSQGLVLTNNHCVWACVRDLSTEAKNLSNEGFLASNRKQELKCPGARVSVLHQTEEITRKVHAAIAGKQEKQANEARKSLLSRLESECEENGDLSCESVNLYHGGQFFLYKYRRYDDVRLVFAPELAVAAFGGDPDNFNFPRWNLDMSFVRVYEDAKPAETPDFFPWYAAGAQEGEPVFVPGHPGSTDRLLTMAELAHHRSHYLPLRLILYSEYRGRMLEWAKTSDEAARQVQQRILLIENAIKVWKNQLRSLMDAEQIARKMKAEAELQEAVLANPELAATYGTAWLDIERAISTYQGFYERYRFIEYGEGFLSDLYDWAHILVRGTREKEKPNEKRLRTYRDTELPRVEQGLFAASPVSPGFQELGLAFSLEKLREWLGPDDELVKAVLGNESPGDTAQRLVSGTRLGDADFRRKLWEGGSSAVQSSDDPMIEFARRVEPFAMELRRRYEDEVEAPLNQASERIAKARFAIFGKKFYPDATFTLRVTYGAVDGWIEKGQRVVPFTRIGRAFERATGNDPFRMPDSWLQAKDQLNLDTRYNFSSTTDIIGGNSGSPVINARGKLVGLAFDGNIHSIAGEFWFDERVNRTVSLHVAAMIEALAVIYGADHLLEELVIERRSGPAGTSAPGRTRNKLALKLKPE
jgi:hypothetical protein